MSVKKRTLKENTFFNVAGRGVEFFITMFIAFIVARYLGKNGYGLYHLILAVTSAIAPVIDMGLGPILIREIVKKEIPARIVIRKGVILRAAAAVLASIILALWISMGGLQWLGGEASSRGFFHLSMTAQSVNMVSILICAIAVFYVRGIAVKTGQDLFIATETLRYDFIATLSSQIVKLLLILTFIKTSGGIPGIFLAFLAGDMTYVLIAYVFVSRMIGSQHVKPLPVQTPSVTAGYFFRQAFPIGLATLFYSLGLQIDKFVLQWFRGGADVGLFSAIYRVITVMFIFIHPVINVFLPRMTRESLSTNDEARSRYRDMSVLLSFGLSVLCFALIFAAPMIIRGFGAEFSGIVSELRWLVIDIFFVAFSFFFLLGLTTRGKQIWVIVSGATALSANFIIDYMLVDQMGVFGAVLGTLVADVIGLTILYYAFCSEFGWINPVESAAPILLGLGITLIVSSILPLIFNGLDITAWAALAAVIAIIVMYFSVPRYRNLHRKVLR